MSRAGALIFSILLVVVTYSLCCCAAQKSAGEKQEAPTFLQERTKKNSVNDHETKRQQQRKAEAEILQQLREQYSTEEIVGQMGQLDLNSVLTYGTSDNGITDGTLNVTYLKQILSSNEIGSLFNSPSAVGNRTVPTVEWWRELNQQLYDLSSSLGSKVPLLFGLDSVHGANYVFGATLFPQQIGLAASFNRENARQAGRITALETRYAGVPWVFSPILGIAVQPSWARVYETFGEDTCVATEMGVAIIQGLQLPPPASMGLPNTTAQTVAACMKHFVGYPNVRTGHDRTPVWTPLNLLLQYFAPPFLAAINRGDVSSAMENYIELNGRPVVASGVILQFLLREVMGFQGMLVTDYNEIFNLHDFHHAAKSYKGAMQMSLNATTIDMGMASDMENYPSMPKLVEELLAESQLDPDRIALSSARVLELKRKLGLLGGGSPVPKVQPSGQPDHEDCVFGCTAHKAAALQAARESVTLLQNHKKLLPLTPQKLAARNYQKVAVIGKACNSRALMSGGWTVHWQGTSNESAIPYGTTIFDELHRRVQNQSLSSLTSVEYEAGCNVTENSVCDPAHLGHAVKIASEADVVIMCLGETHYAEKLGDIDDLTLPGGQLGLFDAVQSVSSNIIVVLVQGRPRLLGDIPYRCPTILYAYLPGPMGSQAIVEILLGEINPSGKLPITYPSSISNAPLQYNRKYSANTGNDYNPQWPFGHGLGYNAFHYSNLRTNFDTMNGYFYVDVTVACEGDNSDLPSTEVVQLYAHQRYRFMTPEVTQLRNFARVTLLPGEAADVSLNFSYEALQFYDEFNCANFEAGAVVIEVGGSSNLNTTSQLASGNKKGKNGDDGVVVSQGLEAVEDFPVSAMIDCTSWTKLQRDHGGISGSGVIPDDNGEKHGPSDKSDYFLYSVVCFGAGIVGTVILVLFLRMRARKGKDKRSEGGEGRGVEGRSILEPARL